MTPEIFLNYLLTTEYLSAIILAPKRISLQLEKRVTLVLSIVEKIAFWLPLKEIVPSLSIFINLYKRLSLGTLTLSKIIHPLSFEAYPNLGPISPVFIPGKCLWESESLIWTINGATP